MQRLDPYYQMRLKEMPVASAVVITCVIAATMLSVLMSNIEKQMWAKTPKGELGECGQLKKV